MKVAYLPQRQKRQNIILAILLIGLPLLLFAAYQIVQISSRAGEGSEPKNVVISSVSSSMITISWTTDSATIGSIIPMDGDKKKTAVKDSRNSGRLYTHYVELDSLEPNTRYSFLIKSEDKEYATSDGKNLEFTTLKVSSDVTPGSILGNIKGGSGEDILVYAFFSDKSTYPVSAQGGSIGSNGSWIISLSDSRKISDGAYAKIEDSTRITLIAVDGKGKTAKLEGTRLELFDSNGELKPTQEFVLGDSGDVYSLLPPEATLSVTTIQPEPEDPDPEDPEPEDPEPEDPEPEDPEEEVPSEDFVDEEFTRVYRIVHQLKWEELASQGDTTSSFAGAKTIRVTDVTDSGFKVIWISNNKEGGYVNYGVSATDLDMKAVDTRDSSITEETGEYFVHNVELDRLQRETKYYFEVVSGDNKYDNNGSKYQQSTVKLIDPPAFKTVGISVDKIPDNGEVAIIAHIEDEDSVGSSGQSKEISCLVPSGEDQCTLVISNSRVEDGSKFYEYTDDDLLILEPYTTFEAEKHTSKLEGLEGSGIDMPLERIASSNTTTIKIAALSSYGLTESANEVITSNGENANSDNVDEIPKTGILDNFISILILSGNLVISGILIYIFTSKKEIKKGKMSKNI